MRKDINFEHNPAILNDFLLYLQNTKNYSINTIKNYESDLTHFFEFIIEYKELNVDFMELSDFEMLQVEESDIIAFLVYRNYTKNNCSYTRQRKLSAIRIFFKWLLNTRPEIQKQNPTANIPNAEPIYRLPKYLTLEQSKRIQTIFNLTNSKTPIRNNTIIALFLSTGMRASELIGINISDINFKEHSIKVVGKGNKQRIVYFNDYCEKQLKKYLDLRERDRKIKNTDALFINLQHKRIGIDGVENICQKAYKLMGLEMYGYTTHTLRHTAATIMYKYGQADITLIKKFLGHESIKSTEIYTHVYNKNVKNAVERNPLNNFVKK